MNFILTKDGVIVMKTIQDLQNLLRQNNGRIKNVKLKNDQSIIDSEGPDPGMIGDIISCYWNKNYDCYVIELDYEPYIEYNKSIASHDWYDKNSDPTLTWFETKYYNKDGKNKIFFSDEFNKLENIFELPQIENQLFTFYLFGQEKFIIEAENLDQAKIKFVDLLIEKDYVQVK
jgi:hypothetical protein